MSFAQSTQRCSVDAKATSSASVDKIIEIPMSTVAEDFAYFAETVSGFYFFVGSTPKDPDVRSAPFNLETSVDRCRVA